MPLTSLGIVDGSPITVALMSSLFCLGKQVKVVIGAWTASRWKGIIDVGPLAIDLGAVI